MKTILHSNIFILLLLLICKLQYAISNFTFIGLPEETDTNIQLRKQGNAPIPVQLIPGTNLRTGVYYTMFLADYKSDDGGYMTISPDHYDGEKGRNHVKLDKSDDYKQGGKLHEHAQWLFIPSEVSGYYEIANRHFMTSMICMGGPSTSGFFVIALEDGATNKATLDEYGKGGEKRDEALWKFVKRRGKFFTIELKKFESDGGGQMNPRGSEIEGGRSNPVQVYGGGPNGREFAKDEMFVLQTALTVDGDIVQLSTNETPKDKLKKLAKVSGAYDLVYLNPTKAKLKREFIETKKIKDIFTFSFKESLTVCEKVEISAQPVPIVSKVDVTISTKFGFEANQQKSVEEEKILTFKLKIAIPEQSCIKILGTYRHIDDAKLAFTADIKITSSVDSMTANRKFIKGRNAPCELVDQYLKDEDFKGRRKNSGSYDCIYLVDGTMKMDIGYEEHIGDQDVPCDQVKDPVDANTLPEAPKGDSNQ